VWEWRGVAREDAHLVGPSHGFVHMPRHLLELDQSLVDVGVI
jgi:hypothetical protein